jgi:flagellar basal-body rod protein FlgF
MTPGMYSVASGMNARWTQQELNAKNISGAAINGYKRQVAAFGSFEQTLHASMDPNVNADLNAPLPYVHAAQHNFETGPQKSTGLPLDAAINGAGFFEVDTGKGGKMLARNWHFTMNAERQLVNDAGHLVMGESGPITVPTGNPEIQADGSITAGGQVVAKLRIVNVANPAALKSEGGELFATGGQDVKAVENAKINNACLESSNVELPREMVDMIQNQRMYDMLTRAMQSQDEGLGRGLQELSS